MKEGASELFISVKSTRKVDFVTLAARDGSGPSMETAELRLTS